MGKLILGLETLPWSILYRAAIGYGVMPAAIAVCGAGVSFAQLLAVLLVILVSLRVIPVVVRRAIPFDREVNNVWAERRALARRFDSYQWQKLFGIGVGWAAYLLFHRRASGAPAALAGTCLVSGVAGLICWLRVRRALVVPPMPAPASPN